MNTKKTIGFLLSVLTLAALGLGGYWLLRKTAPHTCDICARHTHAEARAVVEMKSGRKVACCIRCALTAVRQQGTPVRLVEVTDFSSRQPLDPEAAYYVEGGDLVLCEHQEPLLDQPKRPFDRVFDRCVPSVYAFARSEDAQAFAGSHGGVVLRLPQLLAEVEPRP
ncbi:MAG: hypothetical protein HY652_15505 [Acidobacteria bacterium]|nr:hypothetical protein [Acidobacteriota bacterium]